MAVTPLYDSALSSVQHCPPAPSTHDTPDDRLAPPDEQADSGGSPQLQLEEPADLSTNRGRTIHL